MRLAATLTVTTLLGALAFGIGKLAMHFDSSAATDVGEYLIGSPILAVVLTLVAVAYVPSMLLLLARDDNNPFDAINPVKCMKAIARMGHEYWLTNAFVLSVTIVCFVVNWLIGGIPVAGPALTMALLWLSVMLGGLLVGRLLNRMRHALGDSLGS